MWRSVDHASHRGLFSNQHSLFKAILLVWFSLLADTLQRCCHSSVSKEGYLEDHVRVGAEAGLALTVEIGSIRCLLPQLAEHRLLTLGRAAFG